MRIGRRVSLTAVLIAACWVIWILFPIFPVKTLRVNGTFRHASISKNGNAAHLLDTNRGTLIRLADGGEIIQAKDAYGYCQFLDNECIIASSSEPLLRIFDLENCSVKWQFSGKVGDRRWTPDGGRIVLEVKVENSRVVLFDKQVSGPGIELSNAEAPFAIDDRGRFVVTRVKDDPSALAQWDATNGKKIRDLRMPGSSGLEPTMDIRTDGKKLAVCYFVGPKAFNSERALILWDLDIGVYQRLNFPSPPFDGQPSLPCFGPGTHLLNVIVQKGKLIQREGDSEPFHMFDSTGAVWDTAVDPPTVAKVTHWYNHFDPTGHRYLHIDSESFTKSDNDAAMWFLYDAKSNREIGRGPAIPLELMTFRVPVNGRWLLVGQKLQASERNFMDTWFFKFTERELRRQEWINVIRLDDGQIVKKLPVSNAKIAGLTSHDTAWTFRQESSGDDDETVLEEWQLAPRSMVLPSLATAFALGTLFLRFKVGGADESSRQRQSLGHKALSTRN